MGFWRSLTGRLFKLVFGWYLVLALLVTGVQLVLEYSLIRRDINTNLESLGQSFAPTLSDALWTYDLQLLDAMTKGMIRTTVITGVRVESPKGETLVQAGSVPDPDTVEGDGLLAPYHRKYFPLAVRNPRGQQRGIGRLVIYSERRVALERVRYSFMVILVNSLIKSAGLWLIFYLVISRGLTRPLSLLTGVISRMEFAAASDHLVPLDYPYQDELGRLLAAMDTMQRRLSVTRAQLEETNRDLEKTVSERTAHLSQANYFNEAILRNSPLPIGVYAGTGECVMVNAAFARLVGTTQDALLAQNFHQIVSWQQSGLLEATQLALDQHMPQQLEVHLTTSFGREVWLDCHILPMPIHDQAHVLVQFFDLTERVRHEQELSHFAFYDFLTQLPNRRLLLDRLQLAINNSKRQNSYFGVLYLDLNKFKLLNDTYGHEMGDLLLTEVAKRMRQVLRETDTIARMGGDEFVILLPGLGETPDLAAEFAIEVTNKIRSALEAGYRLGEIEYHGSASIGIKLCLGSECEDPDQILKDADFAMYESKKNANTDA